MIRIMLLATVLCTLVSCQKSLNLPDELPSDKLNYINFNEKELKFNESFSADLDRDGKADFLAYTMHVGDLVLWRDYKRFIFGSTIGAHFTINADEQVPMLSKGNVIRADAFSGYSWHDVAAIIIAQKVITTTQNYWEGVWVNAIHQYLPLRIQKNGGNYYYGWVEVSFDKQTEKLTLHRSAICKEANKAVLAGGN